MGDFTIYWEEKSARKTLKQITNDFDLTQLINGPTQINQEDK